MAAYALLRLGFPEEFWRLWLHSPTPDQTDRRYVCGQLILPSLSLLADQLLDSDMLQPVTELPERLSDRLFAPTLSVRRQTQFMPSFDRPDGRLSSGQAK